MADALRRMVPREYAERLLASRGQARAERRVVTILFCDVKGYSTFAEHLDPEDVMDIMKSAFEYLIGPVYRYEGTLARLMGDAILAFFGAPISHEDDVERAVRAALEIQAGIREYAAQLAVERGIPDFRVRVGLNTGLVVMGEVGSDMHVEYTATGDAINMAARMEQNAPPGGILVTDRTYRLVREAFEFEPQPPLAVKGHAEPMQTHLVLRARPRAFHSISHGVEGIAVSMIGRDAEMERLQATFNAVAEKGECRLATVTGDAGVGKSRLLHEFERWLEVEAAPASTFKGRAAPFVQSVPYGLLRDVFARHLGIMETDSASLVREKLERGIGGGLPGGGAESGAEGAGTMKTHFIGHLLGFDFTDSPHLRSARYDPQQLHDRARIYLAEFFRNAASRGPAVVLLEDLHWADDSSLDAVEQLPQALGSCPLLILCAARPELFERRPRWSEGSASRFGSLELQPLSLEASRYLVGEVLQRIETVPDALRDLVVTRAQGNPFFAEELVKMLIEDGVITKGTGEQDRWQVDLQRVTHARVPDTLSGVLQARLDRLTLEERSVLQQASVVGRLFWDQAVAQISRAESQEEVLRLSLAALSAKEMIFHSETSAFDEAEEYTFKHALLRDIAYETLLKRLRRVYHGLVADWLIERSGKRAAEITGLIGEHLALAGRAALAADYLGRAAANAAAKFANEEAIRYYRRALALWEETGAPGARPAPELSTSLREALGDVYEMLSNGSEARSAYETALAATPRSNRIDRARLQRKLTSCISATEPEERFKQVDVAETELGEPPADADAGWWREWLQIKEHRIECHYWSQDFEGMGRVASEIQPVVEAYGTLPQRANFFSDLSEADFTRNRLVAPDKSIAYDRMMLAYNLEDGNLARIAGAHAELGLHLLTRREISEAESELRLSLELAEVTGNLWTQTIGLTYLTMCCRLRQDLEQVRANATRCLDVATRAQLPRYISVAQANLAWVAWREGDAQAVAMTRAAWDTMRAVGFPFSWVVLCPLLAMALARDEVTEAANLARALLGQRQQRLPDPLTALIEAGIKAADNREPEAAGARLREAVGLAREMGYL